MDTSKGEQNRKYDFIFEGEKTEDFPKEVTPDLNEVMEEPEHETVKIDEITKAAEPVIPEKAEVREATGEKKPEVVHEEKFRFDGKVENNVLSRMELEELGGGMVEEEVKPVLNDELQEIADKTPDEPVKKDMIMSEPTPEEDSAKALEEKFLKAAEEKISVSEKKEMPEAVKKDAKSGGCRGNWVYLLIAGLMGMAIGACVMVALVYSGVIGGKVKTEFRDKIIVQECECEECEECECEKEEEHEDNCGPTGNYTTGNVTNCVNEDEDEGNTTEKENTTDKGNTTKEN